jgi:hypothetical protein
MNKCAGWTLGFLLCLSAGAKAEQPTWQNAPVILSYEDFRQLTYTEQLTYVKRLQQLMVEIDQRDPEAAALFLQKAPFYAQLMGQALPEAFADEGAKEAPPPEERLNDTLEGAKESLADVSKVVQKKTLSTNERANLWNKFRETIVLIGAAGQLANSAPNASERAEAKKKVDALWEEAQKKQGEVVNKLPVNDRKSGEAQFNKIAGEFVKPSLEGKIKNGEDTPDFVAAKTLAESLAASKSAAPAPASAAGSSTGAVTTQAAGIREGQPKSPLAKMDGLADVVEKGVHSTYETSAPTYAPPASTDKFAQMAPARTKKTEVTASTEAAPKHTMTTASKPAATSSATAPPSTVKPPTSSAPAPAPAPKVAKAAPVVGTAPPAPTNPAAAVAAPQKNPREGSGKIKPLKVSPEVSTKGEHYRCMHSGFVIKGDECMAPRTLPFDLVGIDKTKFECAEGTVMCNPFIFGVDSEGCDWVKAAEDKTLDACWKKAKPFCGAPARRSTLNCASNASKKKGSIESAVQIIHANNKVFSLFGEQMKRLCNKKDPKPPIDFEKSRSPRKKVLADIRRTCDDARKTSHSVAIKFNIRYSNAKISPETARYLKENGFDVPADEIDNSGKEKKIGEAEAAAAAASGKGAH